MSFKSHYAFQRNRSDSQRARSRNQRCGLGLILFFLSEFSFAISSFSPRKGPPSGERHEPRQEVKATPFDPGRMKPGFEVPQQKKYKWQLVERDFGDTKESGVAVYSISPGKCDIGLAGRVPAGQIIEVTEMKICGKNYYKFEYKGTVSKNKPNAEFFVDGSNVKISE